MRGASKRSPRLPVQQLAILAVARFAEPLAFTSIWPYLPSMIEGFGVPQENIGMWTGVVSMVFSFSQSATAVPWGTASDRWGRKPILVLCLFANMVCFLLWGMAANLTMALIIRAIQGGSSGSIGIIRTMVAEMVTDKELQPRAFSVMPLVWSLGSVVGPAFGGFFAQPAKQFPGWFGNIEFFKRFPYALPNLMAMGFFLVSLASATLFLKETLASKKNKKDWGILVGERLKRTLSRKPGSASTRRRSFVDGEATAPLVPSKAIPRRASLSHSVSAEKVFTRQTVINLVCYSILAFHSVAYDQINAVFMHQDIDNHSKVVPPFYFTGGFGMSPGEIGTLSAIYGIVCCLVQFILYPPLVNRFGILRCFRFCCIAMPLVYFLTPYTVLFATTNGRFTALLTLLILKAFAIIIAFPSTTILLTNSCSSLKVLGTLNGYATMFSGIARGIGPASTGILFTWGSANKYIVLPYFFLGVMAVLGAFFSFMVQEDSHDEIESSDSDAEVEDSMQNSALFESAISDSDSDDDTSRPLLTGSEPRNYRTTQ